MGSGSAPILVMGQQVDQIVDATNSLTDRLAIGAPLLVVIVGLLLWLVVGRGMQAVEAVRGAVSRMTDGDLNERVESPHTGDELERLVTTMNGMLERISAFCREGTTICFRRKPRAS